MEASSRIFVLIARSAPLAGISWQAKNLAVHCEHRRRTRISSNPEVNGSRTYVSGPKIAFLVAPYVDFKLSGYKNGLLRSPFLSISLSRWFSKVPYSISSTSSFLIVLFLALLHVLLALCVTNVSALSLTKFDVKANDASNDVNASPPLPLSFANSDYIWTDEVSASNPFVAPLGSRAFRKTFNLPPGFWTTTGAALIQADDQFSFYVNGQSIGSGTLSEGPKRFDFTLNSAASEIVVAVNATNVFPTNAFLIGALSFDARECECEGVVLNITTDSTWKFARTVPAGFQDPTFDDSTWKYATVQKHF